MTNPPNASHSTVYEAVGGSVFFHDLVEAFYARVENDPVLRPLYPEDLEPGKEALALFLGQYWGGPTTYSDERGHPRLRMRHVSFRITVAERDAWFNNMVGALKSCNADPAIQAQMTDYFEMAANHLINAE